MRPNDITLQIQEVLVVAQPRQPLQPQQGDTELGSHLLELPGAYLKTLEGAWK